MDATALKAFRSIIANCRHNHIVLLITGINEQPLAVLKKSGIYELIGEKAFFVEVDEAIAFAVDKKKS